jgi:DNA-directed RNA polymerase subunit RPC12/RpoP
MGTTAIDEAKCRGCGATVIETAEEKATGSRIPCPKCGDTRRIFNVSITETVELHGDLAFAHKRKGHKKPIATGKHGDELTRRTGRWAVRTRLIDRENNRYHERVVDKETGEVLHECDEPLTDHVGHGSDKPKKA